MGFTRDTALSAFILAVIGLGVYLLGRSLWERRSGSPTREWLATAAVGIGVILTTVIARPSESGDVVRLRVEDTEGVFSILIAIIALATGAAVGDYIYVRLLPIAAGLVNIGPSTSDSSTKAYPAFVVGSGMILMLGIVIGLQIVDPTVQGEVGDSTVLSVELVVEHVLPDGPKDLVFLTDRSGFISFSDSISHFQLVGAIEESMLELTTATQSTDVSNPRGLVLTDGFLFVADMGKRQEEASGDLYSTTGSVVRFQVGENGELSDRQVVIDEIPIANGLHGVNGLAVGADGLVYLSIGGTRSDLPEDVPNVDWLGTVVRFGLEGEDIEVFANGLRNVYDIEFDASGRLWGVDNDGPTDRGYRAEEVLQIKEGADYGYPFEGTYGNHMVRTDAPVYTYSGHDVEGTAGIELAEKLGIESGIFIGARVVHFFRYDEDEAGVFAAGDFDFQGTEVVFSRQGFFSVVEASGDGYLYVGVTGLSLNSNLYILDVTG